jgi:DNA-binding response OmpR family regulator
MGRTRVLLVDDDTEICEFLATLLEIEGIKPVVATRADEALAELAGGEPFAAVLVDVAMPGVDGLELCRRMRARGISAPILVISARPGMDLPRRATEAGADGFLRKPFENAELVDRLKAWIRSPPAR